MTSRTALISVSDKTDVVALARELHQLGFSIISTGGTAALLRQEGIPVTPVSDVTGFPEIMDGRVKTLHPNIHGGLLGIPTNPAHAEQMQKHGINKIDIAVINLYPFEKTVADSNSTHDDIIENIDIGGPAMIRAAAKNYANTLVVVNPEQYSTVLTQIRESIHTHAEIPLDVREKLAMEAFSHTARYDAMISSYLSTKTGTLFPSETAIPLKQDLHLRYGENPQQQAMLYGRFTQSFQSVHGKELSYNNVLDVDAAAKLCLEFTEPTVCIIKHNNPCGVGSGTGLIDAWEKAFATDTVSPFGGIICVNTEVDEEFASHIHPIFTEVIIAPSFSDGALAILRKKKDRRLVITTVFSKTPEAGLDIRTVTNGFLIQQANARLLNSNELRVVTKRQPTSNEHQAMMFAWKIAKHVKSNAIVYAQADRSLGIGAGQMSRVDSARIAALKASDARLSLQGCAVASDAFFPFADGLLQAAQAGATCIIQPGGSVRDDEVIQAANDHGLAMMFTGMRHFKH
ncbi:MAG: bifunctional phosphoribosylaminoimidazolecarboxamide formyltransferase/IMP cyclohydrolase PurH [Chlorobi bacterium]|nr:MAG: bifunctional phosphoribosylaminoimidazolecarboxamide formyltransferase/IMP cyclohydrolase [Bacteroidota bacterium]KXK34881.1 MAG: phosphoribosylaminoimidazolecarboxamide formyltransferase [Chlorobi bacterium OLB6]MBE2264930.1 bifunctional phosphoribosylaminoimidazolecarboxamide formyltransferase/IMP cyclohydrolase [Flavobacteriales bacterium]MBL1161595.1 bifunctional phosphoribosylaminoimidazolecarboxamide formyltransferase/IMP cyclohydrolase PurH [Chlorobiota bacterium]MBW7854178.1 bif